MYTSLISSDNKIINVNRELLYYTCKKLKKENRFYNFNIEIEVPFKKEDISNFIELIYKGFSDKKTTNEYIIILKICKFFEVESVILYELIDNIYKEYFGENEYINNLNSEDCIFSYNIDDCIKIIKL